MTVGKKIKFFREKKGLTQSELAEIAGIPLGTFQKYEIDYRNPKGDTLEKIACGLGVSPNVFLDVKVDTVGDLASLFFLFSRCIELDFHGEKKHDGKYDENSLSISFKSPFLRKCLGDWACAVNVKNSFQTQAEMCPDEKLRQIMLEHISLVESEAEYAYVKCMDKIEERYE